MMEREIQSSLKRLITRIVELMEELSRLRGQEAEHQLGIPASPADVDAVERLAGFPLPRDYRTFLLMHNGWSGLNGQNDLLSSEQIGTGRMKRSIEETKEIQREQSDPAADGFVIEASLSDTDLAYFDPASRRSDGSMDVVRWDARVGEYRRYPSFTEYLSGYASSLERRIARERGKLR
jgi:SMI1 / KNR4 family (SUKH-1)